MKIGKIGNGATCLTVREEKRQGVREQNAKRNRNEAPKIGEN
jgi:hypothetical protein